jgi:hypothetical protein
VESEVRHTSLTIYDNTCPSKRLLVPTLLLGIFKRVTLVNILGIIDLSSVRSLLGPFPDFIIAHFPHFQMRDLIAHFQTRDLIAHFQTHDLIALLYIFTPSAT